MHGCGHVFELHYNAALLAQRQGDLQEALSQVRGDGMTPVSGSAAVQPAATAWNHTPGPQNHLTDAACCR
jgi:hypothetical protein